MADNDCNGIKRDRSVDEMSHFLDGFAAAVRSERKPAVATGTEGRVCELIAARQRLGLAKYGMSVQDNPLALRQWLQHAIDESLDLAIYLQRSLEELDRMEDDNR